MERCHCFGGFAALTFLAQAGMTLWLPGSTGEDAARIFPVLALGYAAASSVAVVTHILNGMGRPWTNAACGGAAALLASGVVLLGCYFERPPLLMAAVAMGFSYCIYAACIIWRGATAYPRVDR